ncbi:MAG: hypothetical protein JNM19_00560 [Chitinophagaceae bacterium]|nr:hypothetical protein [Chitinophagaceae bacterium]
MKKESDKCDMILRLKTVSSMLVGYGNAVTCTVMDIKKGILTDKEISIVVLPQNKELYEQLESPGQQLFEIGFVKKNNNEPYSIMPMNGFVDSRKTSWEIVYAKKVSPKNKG